MTDLPAAERETWERALDDGRLVSAPDVARRVIADFPLIVEGERERLVFAAILREIKAIAREETEEASQLPLLNSAIAAVPDDQRDASGIVPRGRGEERMTIVGAGDSSANLTVSGCAKRLDADNPMYAAALSRFRDDKTAPVG